MTGTPPITITPEHWAMVRAILQKHVPSCEVWAFGSRVTGRVKPYSDLDLAVISDTPVGWQLIPSARMADSSSHSGAWYCAPGWPAAVRQAKTYTKRR